MKTQKFKRTVSLLLAMLMCVTTLFGMGTTAFAAEETDEVYLISYPRDGDANYGGEWGHNSLSFMNGWSTAADGQHLSEKGRGFLGRIPVVLQQYHFSR